MFVKLVGAIKRWLNVKTWDKAHVKLPTEEPKVEVDFYANSEMRLRADLEQSGKKLDPETVEAYVALNRKIWSGELDGFDAMTAWIQLGFSGDLEEALKYKPSVTHWDEVWEPKKRDESDPLVVYRWEPEELDEALKSFKKDGKACLNCGEFNDKLICTTCGYSKPVIRESLVSNYTFPPLPKGDEPYKATVSVPPRSALWRPPGLNYAEQNAVKLVDQIIAITTNKTKNKYLTGLVVPKLKPALKKKKDDIDRGYRRVTIDAKGKIKEVKEKAA